MMNCREHNDRTKDSTMREVHRLQAAFEQRCKESGLSYFEWLQATEKEFHQSLAEVGFRLVTRNGRTYLGKIKVRANLTKANK
jgi:hypothetical protein